MAKVPVDEWAREGKEGSASKGTVIVGRFWDGKTVQCHPSSPERFFARLAEAYQEEVELGMSTEAALSWAVIRLESWGKAVERVKAEQPAGGAPCKILRMKGALMPEKIPHIPTAK